MSYTREAHGVARFNDDVKFGDLAELEFLKNHPTLIHRPRGRELEDFSMGAGGDRVELKADRYLMDTFANRSKLNSGIIGKSKTCTGSITNNLSIEVGKRVKPSMRQVRSGVWQAIGYGCKYFVYWMFNDNVEFWFDPKLLLWTAAKYRGKYPDRCRWKCNEGLGPDAFNILIPYDELRAIAIPSPLEEP